MVEYSLELRRPVKDLPTVNDLPGDIYMSDISTEKTCMAVIYKTTAMDDERAEQGEERYMLTLYDLSIGKNDQKLTRNTKFMEVDVSYITTCNNPIYIFLSVFGKNGYVALSFVEMGGTGQLTNPSDMFANCIIYGEEETVQKIPFQGRAVFLEDRLALVGYDTLVVYRYTEKNGFKKKYTLDTQALSNGYEATKHQTEIITDIPWAKYVELSKGQLTPVAGHDIITMSRHIQNNVLVTQYGSKDGNIVRIWSIFDGTLLTSYKSQHVEHVMAISDNYRYIATYDEDDKVARIYCTKTGANLHTIPINTQFNADSSEFTLSYMRFFGNGRYIIISGFVPDKTNHQDHRLYTFEVWCIPAQKLLYTDNQEVYWQPNIIPFAMEFESKGKPPALSHAASKSQVNDPKAKVIRYGRQYNLPEMKAIFTSRENQTIEIETKSLFKQDWSKSNKEGVKNWKVEDSNGVESTYKVKFLNNKLLDLTKRSELNDSLDITGNLFCCSIVNGDNHFILRFGYYTVQLWRLKEVPSSVAESERKEIGFQLEEGEDQPCFYKSMEKNKLVYIRAYKANDHEYGQTLIEDWNINLNVSSPDDPLKGRSPEVLFMDNTGHIFVKIERTYEHLKNKLEPPSEQNLKYFISFFQRTWPFNKINGSSNSKKKLNHITDIDEIFLPLLKSSVSLNHWLYNDLGSTSLNSDFHEIESACRALHHINTKDISKLKTKKPELDKRILSILNDKIHQLIDKLLKSNKNVKFFTTVSGSRTLAMLASFQIGQDILKYIITHPRIPISIFNYTRDNYKQESLLTVLIKEKKYDLFNAFFHRVLLDTLETGSGNLHAVAESLLYLQRKRIPELLLNCFKKLSYIPVEQDRHPILKSELKNKILKKLFHSGDTANLRSLESYVLLEQIDKYKETPIGRFMHKYAKLKRTPFIRLLKTVPTAFHWFMFGENIIEYGKLCVVPLLGFNDYKIQLEEILHREYEEQNSKTPNKILKAKAEKGALEKLEYQKSSHFTRMASNSDENLVFKQPGTVMEVITHYKWKTFLRSRFYLILLIHALYYISYSTAISFPQKLYNYTPGDKITDPRHIASTVLMFVSGFILLVQEILQFHREKIVYLTSFFNCVDIAAFTLPVANFCLLLKGSEFLIDVGSITILILWVHAILRLRVFSYFGKILETIIQILLKIMPFIFIMILVVFAFTHALIYRLGQLNDQFFQEKYQGGPSDAEGHPLDNSTLITVYDTSSQNDFSNPFKAFSVVWFFIYGVFDPVNDGDAGDDIMTKILIILFSFVTILIFSNMVIALMSSTVDEVRRQGKVARWTNYIYQPRESGVFKRLSHFSAVVSEIELLWCLPKEKHSRKNNPHYIYYIARGNAVDKHCEELRNENQKLIKNLRST